MAGLAEAIRGWQKGIPCPWRDLSEKVVIRPGGLTLITGAPGSLKSMLSLNWALALDSPTLYLSLDTPMPLQGARVISHQTGQTTHRVHFDLDEDTTREQWVEWLAEWDRKTKLRMSDVPATASEVGEMMRAWGEYWGQVPLLTIIDDIEKLKGVRDYQTFAEMIVELGRIAKKENTVIIGIHHLNRQGGTNEKKPRVREMLYSGEYEAPYVLGLWRPDEYTLNVSVLKNRTGEEDQNGGYYAQLAVDASRALIRDATFWEMTRGSHESAYRSGYALPKQSRDYSGERGAVRADV